MRDLIVGAGAVGNVMAAMPARAGHEVSIVCRGAHLAAVRERGIELRHDDRTDRCNRGL
jgi:2-dehydropantoate 2-reductase